MYWCSYRYYEYCCCIQRSQGRGIDQAQARSAYLLLPQLKPSLPHLATTPVSDPQPNVTAAIVHTSTLRRSIKEINPNPTHGNLQGFDLFPAKIGFDLSPAKIACRTFLAAASCFLQQEIGRLRGIKSRSTADCGRLRRLTAVHM
jgi:hypothetical protein